MRALTYNERPVATPMNSSDDAAEAAAFSARTIKLVAIAIAFSALLFAAAAAFFVNIRFATGIVAGGDIGLSNFLVLARVGKAITGSREGAVLWGGIYLLKVAALFGGVALLLHSGIVSGLGLVVGFSALVPGIVVGGLLAAPKDPNHGAGANR